MVLSLLPHSSAQMDDQQKCWSSIEGLNYRFDSTNATILGQMEGMELSSTQPILMLLGIKLKFCPEGKQFTSIGMLKHGFKKHEREIERKRAIYCYIQLEIFVLPSSYGTCVLVKLLRTGEIKLSTTCSTYHVFNCAALPQNESTALIQVRGL